MIGMGVSKERYLLHKHKLCMDTIYSSDYKGKEKIFKTCLPAIVFNSK